MDGPQAAQTHEGRRDDAPQAAEASREASREAGRRTRRAPLPWRERAREVLLTLREWARDRDGPGIEAFLRTRLGDDAADASVADLQRLFDDFLCAPGSGGKERSLIRAFAEEHEDLTKDERDLLPSWETERTRKVCLLDRAHRDRLDLWDPVGGGRIVLHLLEKMPPARAAALSRGAVIIATWAPWNGRRIALGQIEIYDDDNAIEMYRNAVRDEDRPWTDLPAATPIA